MSNIVFQLVGGLGKVFVGLGSTLKNVFRRKVTVRYPYERRPIAPRYRGLFYLKWNDEKQRLNCVGCGLCVQACPTGVIELNKIGKGADAGVDHYTMDLGKCMFCDLCVEACPFDAIHMGQGYELAVADKDGSIYDIEKLAEGGPEHAMTSIENVQRLAEAAERAAQEKAALLAAQAAKSEVAE